MLKISWRIMERDFIVCTSFAFAFNRHFCHPLNVNGNGIGCVNVRQSVLVIWNHQHFLNVHDVLAWSLEVGHWRVVSVLQRMGKNGNMLSISFIFSWKRSKILTARPWSTNWPRATITWASITHTSCWKINKFH